MSQTKLSDVYRYRPLSKYEGLVGKLPCRAGTTYVGVEIELENVTFKDRAVHPHSYKVERDGSLRNEGLEFITIPIPFCYLEEELKRLFKNLSGYKITSRCSTHVHLNVRDFTEDELFKFLVLYLVFERSLYRVSGDRWDNIFCVPLGFFDNRVAEALMFLHNTSFGGVRKIQWNKYSGLNLCPIWGGEGREGKAIGTVEFRQMEGSTDVKRIINWINLIVSLKISAKMLETKELLSSLETLNTTSDYWGLCDRVFREWSSYIKDQPTYKQDVERCITKAKYILLKSGAYPQAEMVEV